MEPTINRKLERRPWAPTMYICESGRVFRPKHTPQLVQAAEATTAFLHRLQGLVRYGTPPGGIG